MSDAEHLAVAEGTSPLVLSPWLYEPRWSTRSLRELCTQYYSSPRNSRMILR
jgi:hypothetical protein